MRIKAYQEEGAVHRNKEQQLREELKTTQLELKNVTKIKEQFENNVNEITESFKRLYEEADMARMIVVKKLKEIQEREREA